MKACPHCGAVLPDEASFCPSCAKSVIIREKARRCKRLPVKAVFVFFAVLAAVLLAVFIWSLPPKTYDNGTAEALMTRRAGPISSASPGLIRPRYPSATATPPRR